MAREIVIETIGSVKIYNSKLQIYNDHQFIAEITLTDKQKLQLIAELTDELRYPD